MTKLLRFLPLFILLGCIVAAYAFDLHSYLSLEQIKEQKEQFKSYIEAHPYLSPFIFMSAYIASVALSLPIATLLTLLGGFLFGFVQGTLLVVLSATLGATILFIIAKTSLGVTLREKAGGLYNKVENNMKENAVGYLLFMRLVPVFPFVLVNVLPALFNVSLKVFFLTTFFGIMPGSAVFVYFGQQLGEINAISDLVRPELLLAFALLGVFAVIPTLYNQYKSRKKGTCIMKNFLVPLSILLIIFGFSPAFAYENDLDGLLKDHVKPVTAKNIQYNGVDYTAWGADERHEKVRDALLSTNPENLSSKNEKLAYWINTYNVLTIDLIARENEQKSIKNLGSTFTSPWKKHKWSIVGKNYSLDQIEHEIIRPLGEPRIHFAINCAAKSCPDLRMEAYRADKLEAQLEEQTKLTFENSTKGYKKDDGNMVRVTKVMSWFKKDFDNGDLNSWLQSYLPEDVNDETQIKFFQLRLVFKQAIESKYND